MILERLKALRHLSSSRSLFCKTGLKKAYTPPKVALRDVPKQIADLIPTDPLASRLCWQRSRNFADFRKRIGPG